MNMQKKPRTLHLCCDTCHGQVELGEAFIAYAWGDAGGDPAPKAEPVACCVVGAESNPPFDVIMCGVCAAWLNAIEASDNPTVRDHLWDYWVLGTYINVPELLDDVRRTLELAD